MKKRTLLLFTGILFSFFAYAQEKGIRFEQNLSWQQILDKAKSENKYVFVDCFATWCGPCKEMDQTIYPDENVGEFFNEHFVSVKVQMDCTKNDQQQVKDWYSDALFLRDQYVIENGVVSYPSFLFFSPEGKIVDKWSGLMGSLAFHNYRFPFCYKNRFYTL